MEQYICNSSQALCMAGKLIWSKTLFKICGKQHLFSPPTSNAAMFRLANRVSDKLAWPRSRALNTGAEAELEEVAVALLEAAVAAAALLDDNEVLEAV